MITPTWQTDDGRVQLYLGDCLTILPHLDAVDAVVTDPPYSIHVHANGMRGARDGSGKIFGEAKDFGFDGLGADTRSAVAALLSRLVQRWCLVFSDIEGASEWRADLVFSGLQYIRTGAWVKIAPTPQFSGDRPAAGFEAITIAHPPGRKRWNGGGRAAVWTHCAHGGAKDIRFHKAQKPLPLMAELVTLFTDDTNTVLDPFMGSGTTGIACIRLGRKFIGIEIEPKYFEIAKKRIQNELAQGDFFRDGTNVAKA